MKNIGKLYYKDYFKDINFNYLFENEVESKKIQKSNKEKIKEKNKVLIEKTANNWNNKLIKNPCCNSTQNIEAKIEYPGLVTGIGINHEASIEEEFKLGVHFDYTFGVPVIYGSSIKGALRSAFPEKKDKEKIKNQKSDYIKKILGNQDLEIEKFRDWIFEGIEKVEITTDTDGKEKKRTHYLSVYKRDIFFDAVIKEPYRKIENGRTIKERILESDSITPHGGNPLKNPIPITFIKIASGVTLEFRFSLQNSIVDGIHISTEQKKELFRKILFDFGIGAKTNVGYGQFY